MSQSEAHRNLVLQVAKAIEARYFPISVITDLQQNPGDAVPPMIRGYRPDVYAHEEVRNIQIIAEAKTDSDLKNLHTQRQLMSFIGYLSDKERSLFILSVTGTKSDQGKTLLRFTHRLSSARTVALEVFDGHDFWSFNLQDKTTWDLL